jgi:hypothetical protein
MRGNMPPFPQYVLMSWCLVKHKNNFTFYTCLEASVKSSLNMCHTRELAERLLASREGLYTTKLFVMI